MDAFADLHFIRPVWLFGLLPCLFLFWGIWHRNRSHQGWSQVIDPELLPHLIARQDEVKNQAPLQSVLLWWLLIILALAGPSWEKIPQPVQRKQDALVVILDLSPSMLTEDVNPSRLERSKRKLRDLMKLRTEGTTALIAFAGDAHIVSPLTDDTRTIGNLIPALYPAMMPAPGSDSAGAVALAIELFQSAGMIEGHILLITDGISAKRRTLITERLSDTHYSLSVIGVGSRDGGPIPGPSGQLLKDGDGGIVIARLNRISLERLALDNRGNYRDISLNDADLSVLERVELLTETSVSNSPRNTDSWHDAGYWLVLVCLPLTLFAFRRGWVLAVSFLILLPPQQAQAQSSTWKDLWQRRDQQAAQLFEQGQIAEAAELFDSQDWAGAAHYRAENFEDAKALFNLKQDADSWYNQGNALAKSGDLAPAIEAYDKALTQQPGMEDAIFNKELVEELMRQQDQQQNQNQASDDQQDQQGQQDQSSDHQEPESPDKTENPKQPQEQKSPEETEPTDAASKSAEAGREQDENDQATEAWLRQIPDDPAGLLRRKFKYESEQRQQHPSNSGANNNDW